jgi:hypothetical protein
MIIDDFSNYQIDWLTSHNDIEFCKEEEDLIVRFIKDTAEMYQSENQCEDCISRNELLSRIDAERKHLLDIKMDGAEHVIVHHARRIIEDMPSVTPQQKMEVEE